MKALNDRNGSVLRTHIFSAAVPVRGAANGDYVAALNQAFDQVSRDIVDWTLKII